MLDRLRSLVVALLIKSERYLKTDVRYLAKGGFFVSMNQIVAILGSLVTSVLFAHIASKETYGLYKYILGIVTIFNNLSLLGGIKLTMLQLSSHDEPGAMRLGFWLNLATSVVIFAGSIGGGFYYMLQGNLTLAVGVLVAGGLQPFVSSFGLCTNYLNGRKDFVRSAILGSFETLLTVVMISGALILNGSVISLIIAYAGSNLIGNVISYLLTVRRYPEAIASSKERYRDFLRLSSHVSFIGIIKGVANNLDTIIIFHALGAAPLAIYSYAVAIPEQITGLIGNAIYTLAVPRLAVSFSDKNPNAHQDPVQEHKRTVRSIFHKALVASLVAIPVALIYYPFAPLLYHILLPQYAVSVGYSQIFAFMIILSNLTSVFGSFQDSQRNVRDKYIASVPAALLRIVLMLILVRPFGLWGIIASEFTARAMNGLVSYFLLLWRPIRLKS